MQALKRMATNIVKDEIDTMPKSGKTTQMGSESEIMDDTDDKAFKVRK